MLGTLRGRWAVPGSKSVGRQPKKQVANSGRVSTSASREQQLTARALRRTPRPLAVDDFPEQLVELFGYFDGAFPEGHPYRHITATPGRGYRPAVWLLGSSDYSAQAAGMLGLPFSFAHHFAAANTLPAVAANRSAFRPSEHLDEPYVMLGVNVLCADTDDRARWLAGSGALAFLRLRSGHPGRYPPEEAAGYQFTPQEREAVKAWTRSHVVGSPDTVREQLAELVERTGADELMVSTLTHGTAERLRSHQLVAEAARLAGTTPPASAPAGAPTASAGH
jgi:luciferase family oxidoreductase group 1